MSEWRHVYRYIKIGLMVGRTVRGLDVSVPPEDADLMRETYGIVSFSKGSRAWSSLSVTQRLDLVATRILMDDRIPAREAWREGQVGLRACDKRRAPTLLNSLTGDYPILSPIQMHNRAKHELPWPDLDGLAQAMKETDRRRSLTGVVDGITGGFGLRMDYRWSGFREDYVDRTEELRVGAKTGG